MLVYFHGTHKPLLGNKCCFISILADKPLFCAGGGWVWPLLACMHEVGHMLINIDRVIDANNDGEAQFEEGCNKAGSNAMHE